MPFVPPKSRLFLGIDPGSSGGMAIINSNGLILKDIHNQPALTALGNMTAFQQWDWLSYFEHSERQYVYGILEKVGGFVPRAKGLRGAEEGSDRGQPGSTMFTFGKTVGMLIGFLTAANIPYIEVIPRTWQKEFGLQRLKSQTDSQWKNVLKNKATYLFPEVKITLATADALLMAEYCRRSRA